MKPLTSDAPADLADLDRTIAELGAEAVASVTRGMEHRLLDSEQGEGGFWHARCVCGWRGLDYSTKAASVQSGEKFHAQRSLGVR